MARTTYIKCQVTGEFVEKTAAHRNLREQHASAFTPFKSPIDGKIVGDRKQLRDHNKRHGVTDMRDYSQSHFDKAQKLRHDTINGRAKGQREERVNDLKRTMHEMNTRRR